VFLIGEHLIELGAGQLMDGFGAVGSHGENSLYEKEYAL
jgi:hypothetical protein